jgi:hypothetical protein
MPVDKGCASCRFCREPIERILECHRYAPRPLVVAPMDKYDPEVAWPSVGPKDWCGEWRRKEGWE